MAGYMTTYIDSDILNTFSLNLTLSEWLKYTDKSGLHFISSAELIPSLAKTLSPNIFPLLFPKSREALSKLVAINTVAAFHRLIFRKQAPLSIPWNDFDALLNCGFQTTQLYSIQNPASEIYGELILNANTGQGHDVNFRWPIENITKKLLDYPRGIQQIRDVIDDSPNAFKGNENALTMKLFMLYQLGIIKVSPNIPQTKLNEE